VKTLTHEIAFKIVDEFMSHNQEGILETTIKHEGRGDPDLAFGFGSESLKYLGFSVEGSTMRAFMVALNLANSNCHLKALEENLTSVSKDCQRSPDPASSIRIELSKTNTEN
jgi:hypothetical protein